jgi:hypothetical protein
MASVKRRFSGLGNGVKTKRKRFIQAKGKSVLFFLKL